MRVQRTRSSASRHRAPLTRRSLGDQGRLFASITVGMVLLLSVSTVGHGDDIRSASDARRALLEGSFTIVTKTQEIPEPVLVLFASLTNTKGRVLADPGARYQVTDVVSEPGLPWRRLVFAGNGKGIYFLNYERGGIAHSQLVAVFEYVPGRVSLVWRAALNRKADSLTALRDAVRKGQYSDGSEYGF